MVRQWHRSFGVYAEEQPRWDIPSEVVKLRTNILHEEVKEYEKAATEEDLRQVAKELADIAYTLFGTVVAHGLQEVFEEVFDEVHRSNMSKLDDNGKPVYREDGKVLKSKNFKPADLSFISE